MRSLIGGEQALNRRIALIAGFLAVAALAAWLLLSNFQDENSEDPSEDLSGEPDARLLGAEVIEYGEDGKPLFEARASLIQYLAQIEAIELQHIDLSVSQGENTQWSFQAPSAVIKQLSDTSQQKKQYQIDLEGSVSVASQTDGQTIMSLTGRDLVYLTDQRILSSDQPVTITANAATARAGSFVYDLERDELHLTSSQDNRVHIVLSPDPVP